MFLPIAFITLASAVGLGHADHDSPPENYCSCSYNTSVTMLQSWDYGAQYRLSFMTSEELGYGDQIYFEFCKSSWVTVVESDGIWTNFGPEISSFWQDDSLVGGYANISVAPHYPYLAFNVDSYNKNPSSTDICTPQVYCKTSSSSDSTTPDNSSSNSNDDSVRAYDSCGSGKKMALTFDDGPAVKSSQTATILDLLDKAGVKATFFVCPQCYDTDETAAKCGLVKQMVDAGHYVGCHSWDHPDFTSPILSNSSIKNDQMDPCVNWVSDCSGTNFQTQHFRPPYGRLLWSQANYISEDLEKIIAFWTIDALDYNTPGDYNQIWSNINSVFTNFYSTYGYYGSQIIDLHDVNEYNAFNQNGKSVIEMIVDTYGPNGIGYEFITVDQCYNNCDSFQDGICKSKQTTHYQLCDWPDNSNYVGC